MLNLARVYRSMGEDKKAEEMFKRSVNVFDLVEADNLSHVNYLVK